MRSLGDEQAGLVEPLQERVNVTAQRRLVDVELAEHVGGHAIHIPVVLAQQLPYAGADRVEREVPLAAEVEEHQLALDLLGDDVGRGLHPANATSRLALALTLGGLGARLGGLPRAGRPASPPGERLPQSTCGA